MENSFHERKCRFDKVYFVYKKYSYQHRFFRQIEGAENQVSAINRIKSQLGNQIEELRRQLEQESRDRQSFASQV